MSMICALIKSEDTQMNRTLIPENVLRDFKPKSVQAQLKILRSHFDIFSTCKPKTQISKGILPEGTEGWFVGSSFSLLSESYREAISMVLEAISEKRKVINLLESGKNKDGILREAGFTAGMLETMSDFQDKNNVMIYPAQLGENYYGLTPGKVTRRLRGDRFGLTTFLVGLILLTHEELLSTEQELAICCVGDEYSPNANYNFDSSSVFYCKKDGSLVLDYINRGYNWNCTVGCATGKIICVE